MKSNLSNSLQSNKILLVATFVGTEAWLLPHQSNIETTLPIYVGSSYKKATFRNASVATLKLAFATCGGRMA
jgi:hypothetical protein